MFGVSSPSSRQSYLSAVISHVKSGAATQRAAPSTTPIMVPYRWSLIPRDCDGLICTVTTSMLCVDEKSGPTQIEVDACRLCVAISETRKPDH